MTAYLYPWRHPESNTLSGGIIELLMESSTCFLHAQTFILQPNWSGEGNMMFSVINQPYWTVYRILLQSHHSQDAVSAYNGHVLECNSAARLRVSHCS